MSGGKAIREATKRTNSGATTQQKTFSDEMDHQPTFSYRSTHGRDERWHRGEAVDLGCRGQHDHVLNPRSDRRRWYTGFLQNDYNKTIHMNDADKGQLPGYPVGFLPWLFTTAILEYCLQAEM